VKPDARRLARVAALLQRFIDEGTLPAAAVCVTHNGKVVLHEGGGRLDRSKRRGFTLIELVVVLVVLGILATMAVLGGRHVKIRMNDAACLRNLHEIGLALEAYRLDHHGRYTNSFWFDLYPRYLSSRRMFCCPFDKDVVFDSAWDSDKPFSSVQVDPAKPGIIIVCSYSGWFENVRRRIGGSANWTFDGPDWENVFKKRGGQTPLMACVHHHPRGMPVLRADGTVEIVKRERPWQDL